MPRDFDLRGGLAQSKLAGSLDDNCKVLSEVSRLGSPNQKTALGKLCMSLSRQAAGDLGEPMSALQFTPGA